MNYSKFKILIIFVVAGIITGCSDNDIDTPEEKPDTETGFRQPSDKSSALANTVFEYTPAPGQFINDAATMGKISTPEEAAAWAKDRLDRNVYVTLGAYGGYIVVGFDHSIASSHSDYDFAVAGNAYLNATTLSGGSNEPGIVSVMQDTNGNGQPDDVWYELKGSDYDAATTIHNYSVTYYRPSEAGKDVKWTDNQGESGIIPYIPFFHKQDSYYPEWIKTDQYTLTATRLESRMYEEGGIWNNPPFSYGYADNMGTDNTSLPGFPQCNRFRISDACHTDGSPANLKYIDFVKIQTGVVSQNLVLGELSTEIFGVIDLALYPPK